MKVLTRVRTLPTTVKSGYNYTAEQKRLMQGYVSQHPRFLVTLVVYAALMWPLLVLMIMVLIAFAISIFVSSMTITLLMAPVVVGLLQTAMVVLGVSYTVVWFTEKCAKQTRERRRARKQKQRDQKQNQTANQQSSQSTQPNQSANQTSNPANQTSMMNNNNNNNQASNAVQPVRANVFNRSEAAGGYANVFNDHLDQPFHLPRNEDASFSNHPLVLDTSAEVVNRRNPARMNNP